MVRPALRAPIVLPALRAPIVLPALRAPIVVPALRAPIVLPAFRAPIAPPAFRAPSARPALRAETEVESLLSVGDTAGLLPKCSTRISGMSLPVASRIFSFWASVSLIFTSFAIFSFPPGHTHRQAAGQRIARIRIPQVAYFLRHRTSRFEPGHRRVEVLFA